MMKQTIKTMLALLALLVSSTGAWADTVHYLDESGTDQTVDATAITSESTSLAAGWYYVEGDVTIYSQVSLTGNVNIILCDNATLTINSTAAGIMKTGYYDVKIYAQSTGAHMGQLSIIAANEAIFSYRTYIYGGNISVSGSVGIKADDSWTDDGIAITNGIVNATGTNGDGLSTNNSILNISGGQVTATGSTGHYGINAGTGEIKLSWSRPEDFILSNSYNAGTLTLVRDFKLNGGTTAAYWTSSSDNNINGYKIVPANIVAKIGNMYYPTLQATFNAAADHDVIDILTDINEPTADKTYTGDHNHTFNLNGHSVTFGSHNAMGSLTINGSGTLICNSLNNTNVNGDKTLTIDGATVVCNNGIEWMADHIVLKGGADVTVNNSLFLGGGENKFTFTIQDNASILKMINCTISGYGSNDVLRNQFLPYVQPGMTLHVGDGIANTVSFRETWGLQLNHSFSTNAIVTFWNGGTSEPVSDSFDPTLYPDANKITKIDNAGDTEDRYIIMHIVPAAGYWTDQQLLMAMETGASLAPSKAPGLDLGQALTLLKADDGRHDGAGWYYYKLSKDHNVTNGYYNSTLDGFVVPKFDLNTATLSTTTASTSEVTLTANAAGNWQTIIKLNKTSFEYNGQNQTSTFSNAGNKIVVTKDGTTAAEFTIGDYLNFKIKNTGTDPVTLVESMKNAGGYTGVVGTFANTIFTNSKDVPFAITKKALTVTAKPKTITYGDTPVNDGVTYTGFVDGENENTAGIFGTSALSYAYSYAQYGNVGNTYTITPSGLTAANYDITFVNGTLTVNQKEVGLNWGATTFTYNGTAQAPTCTATGLVNNDVINVTVTGTQTTTGNYTATASALTGDKAGNYKLPAANTQAFTINPKRVNDSNIADDKDNNITIVLTDIPTEGYTYDGTAKTPTITVKDGDTEIPSGEYTVTITNNTNAGTATVTITDKDGGNYNVSGTTTFTINKASTEIAIAVPTLDNLNVNDEIASGASLSPAAAGSLTYTSSNPSVAIVENGTIKALAAGTATITVSFAGNDNYSAAVSKTIAVTVSLNNASVSVDNGTNLELLVGGTHNIVTTTTPDGLTVTYTADASGVVSVDAAGKITALKEGNATITVSVGGDGVYTENSKTVNVHVTKVLTNPDINLGGFTVTGGYTYNGDTQKPTITVKDGETTIPADEYTVTIKDGDGNTVTDPKDAGTYTVVITDNDGGNYTVSGTTTFTINKATLTVTANAQEKEIGADDPAMTYTYEGLAAGDNITGNLTREAGEAVGSYAISKGTLTAGDNYDIDFTEATLTIYRTLSLFSGSNEWATYVAQEDLAVPAGIKAYIVTSVNGNTIITKNISYIPANVPILLQRTDNTVGDVKAVAGTGTDDVSGNKLVGNATAATDIQTYKDYVLYNNQFVLAGVSSVGAGKAYLPATAIISPAGAPRFLTISDNSETMGINSLTPTLSEGEGAWYTLDGHKLNGKPAKKGLYIKNGVKVVIK